MLIGQPNSVEVSIVSPVYHAEAIVPVLVERLKAQLEALTKSFEIVLVDDGSADDSWLAVARECAKDHRVKGIKLSRNFGQHNAVTAGLKNARGAFVVIMDCDLQDNPSYLATIVGKARAGSDLVLTQRRSRQHSAFKNITAVAFGRIFNTLTSSRVGRFRPDVGSYCLLSRKVVDAFLSVNDYHRHFLMVLGWMGFQPDYVQIEHEKRHSGRSSYSTMRLIRHAIDGLTSQSDRLLYVSIFVGMLFCLGSLLGAVAVVALFFFHGALQGWASLATVMLLSTGAILMSTGILGIYVGKIFEQVKGRPLFILDKTLNLDEGV